MPPMTQPVVLIERGAFSGNSAPDAKTSACRCPSEAMPQPSAGARGRSRGRPRRPVRGGEVSSSAEHPLTWGDFEEQPATEVDLRSPAAELAVVLQRYRADLDEAARAGSESRVQGLRALADQAVLAVELAGLLELQQSARDVSPERMHGALLSVKDRMLAHVASSGLEIVRLCGARGGDVAESVDVDQWRYDDGCTAEVVVEELEVAVRLDGEPLRRGRVVMGAPREVGSTARGSAESEPAEKRTDSGVTRRRAVRERPPAPTIVCPVADCGTRKSRGCRRLRRLSDAAHRLRAPHDAPAGPLQPRPACGTRGRLRNRARVLRRRRAVAAARPPNTQRLRPRLPGRARSTRRSPRMGGGARPRAGRSPRCPRHGRADPGRVDRRMLTVGHPR